MQMLLSPPLNLLLVVVVKKNKKCTSAVWNDFTKFNKEIKTEVDGKEVITMIKMAKCNHCGFETNANSCWPRGLPL